MDILDAGVARRGVKHPRSLSPAKTPEAMPIAGVVVVTPIHKRKNSIVEPAELAALGPGSAELRMKNNITSGRPMLKPVMTNIDRSRTASIIWRQAITHVMRRALAFLYVARAVEFCFSVIIDLPFLLCERRDLRLV
jgi:hypothetical protein